MNNYQALNENEEMKKILERVNESLARAPKGSLRSEMSKGKYPQYYYQAEDNKGAANGIYIKKADIEFAAALAQKEYDMKVLKLLKRHLKEPFYSKEEMEIDLIILYNSFPTAKKLLIKPYVLADEDYVEKWKNSHPGEQNSFTIVNGFTSEQGEVVRSKSEKMISDKLFYNRIPYVYEAALTLKNNIRIFPDFTILNLQKRKTYYLEHFGMMDDPEYCRKAIEKIELYEASGIYLGESLLVTFESSTRSINMQRLNMLIDKYFKPE